MPHEYRGSLQITHQKQVKMVQANPKIIKDHQRSQILNTFLMVFEELHGSGNLASLFGFECQDGAITVSPLDRLLIIGTFDQVCFKVKVCPSCCQLLVACKDTLKPSRMQTVVKTHVMHTNMIKHVHMRGFSDPNLQSLPAWTGGSSKARDQGRALSGDTEIRVATDAITTSNFLLIPCGKCTETVAFHGCMSMLMESTNSQMCMCG